MAAFLLMEALMLGVFAAQDLFLFYIFFEGGLIPMFLIIGIWGGAERIKASYKFFLYTLLGSVLMLIAMMYMVIQAGTTSIPVLMANDFPVDAQKWLWLAFFASFAVKMPMWPVHTWLPRCARPGADRWLGHPRRRAAEDGRLRFHPLLAADVPGRLGCIFIPLVFILSGIAVVYTSLVALVQRDMKKLIAYSSVAHMAFVTFGLFAFNRQGIEGAMMVMLGPRPGLGRALPLRRRRLRPTAHPRDRKYGGLIDNMPAYALLFMVFTMASVGLPGTSNFVGEFLSLVGTYKVSSWAAIVATTGIILGAAYMLWLYWRICFRRGADQATPRR